MKTAKEAAGITDVNNIDTSKIPALMYGINNVENDLEKSEEDEEDIDDVVVENRKASS